MSSSRRKSLERARKRSEQKRQRARSSWRKAHGREAEEKSYWSCGTTDAAILLVPTWDNQLDVFRGRDGYQRDERSK